MKANRENKRFIALFIGIIIILLYFVPLCVAFIELRFFNSVKFVEFTYTVGIGTFLELIYEPIRKIIQLFA